MHNDLIEAGWTDAQWSRIVGIVTEEAQKSRVAARILPVVGPEDRAAVGFADFRISVNPRPRGRLETNNLPNHPLTTIAVPVQLTTAEVADPDLEAALVKFRRAANVVARLEDAVIFNDRLAPGRPLGGGLGVPFIDQVTGGGPAPGERRELGLLPLDLGLGVPTPVQPRQQVRLAGAAFSRNPRPRDGQRVVQAILRAMSLLENQGHNGPFACALSPYFFEAVYSPNLNFVAARDRILPILNGPLVRSSAITDEDLWGNLNPYGVVVALGGDLVALRVAADIAVRFVQTTAEPRYLFRVSERLGLRISDPTAIAVLTL
jgi:uncharacterized linocin/CFP29 family protein